MNFDKEYLEEEIEDKEKQENSASTSAEPWKEEEEDSEKKLVVILDMLRSLEKARASSGANISLSDTISLSFLLSSILWCSVYIAGLSDYSETAIFTMEAVAAAMGIFAYSLLFISTIMQLKKALEKSEKGKYYRPRLASTVLSSIGCFLTVSASSLILANTFVGGIRGAKSLFPVITKIAAVLFIISSITSIYSIVKETPSSKRKFTDTAELCSEVMCALLFATGVILFLINSFACLSKYQKDSIEMVSFITSIGWAVVSITGITVSRIAHIQDKYLSSMVDPITMTNAALSTQNTKHAAAVKEIEDEKRAVKRTGGVPLYKKLADAAKSNDNCAVHAR